MGKLKEFAMDINLNPGPLPRCKHCRKIQGLHKAKTLECPQGKAYGGYNRFGPSVFEPVTPRTSKRNTSK